MVSSGLPTQKDRDHVIVTDSTMKRLWQRLLIDPIEVSNAEVGVALRQQVTKQVTKVTSKGCSPRRMMVL
jgi:hypothetical protein